MPSDAPLKSLKTYEDCTRKLCRTVVTTHARKTRQRVSILHHRAGSGSACIVYGVSSANVHCCCLTRRVAGLCDVGDLGTCCGPFCDVDDFTLKPVSFRCFRLSTLAVTSS